MLLPLLCLQHACRFLGSTQQGRPRFSETHSIRRNYVKLRNVSCLLKTKTKQNKETSKDVLQLLGVISRIFQEVLEMTLNNLQFVYFAIPCKCLFNYILPIKSSLTNVSSWHISQHVLEYCTS